MYEQAFSEIRAGLGSAFRGPAAPLENQYNVLGGTGLEAMGAGGASGKWRFLKFSPQAQSMSWDA